MKGLLDKEWKKMLSDEFNKLKLEKDDFKHLTHLVYDEEFRISELVKNPGKIPESRTNKNKLRLIKIRKLMTKMDQFNLF